MECLADCIVNYRAFKNYKFIVFIIIYKLQMNQFLVENTTCIRCGDVHLYLKLIYLVFCVISSVKDS